MISVQTLTRQRFCSDGGILSSGMAGLNAACNCAIGRFLVGAYELVNVAGDPANAAEVSSLATLTAGLITSSGSACAALETVARP